MPRCQCIARTTNKQCRKMALDNSMFCASHQQCLYAIRGALPPVKVIQKLDPNVQSVVSQIKQKLAEVEQAVGKENKIFITIKLYDILATPSGLKLIEKNPKLKETVKQKLLEQIEQNYLTFLIPYYEKLIGETYVRFIPIPGLSSTMGSSSSATKA